MFNVLRGKVHTNGFKRGNTDMKHDFHFMEPLEGEYSLKKLSLAYDKNCLYFIKCWYNFTS